jgi:hypothetical protein
LQTIDQIVNLLDGVMLVSALSSFCKQGETMVRTRNRREFLSSSVLTGAALTAGDLGFLSRLRPVSAAEASLDPAAVQFHPEIEPLVRLLEETPREKLIEVVAHRIAKGLSYRELLTALLLAGVRNVQPRPAVGFKFHAVLVVNSAHLASLSSPDRDRWLPILWAIDYFKSAQEQDVRENNWTMAPVDESQLPSADQAADRFKEAMEKWDESGADVASAAMARHLPAHQAFELFARYAARDFRSIGHKIIYLSNAWRTLQCIGWRHAEPVLRSLAYAMLNHADEPNPAESDLAADRPWRLNQELAKQLRDDWYVGTRATSDDVFQLVRTLRGASPEEACRHAVELLNDGVAVSVITDGLFLSSGELLMRQPGIVSLHAVTSTNALAYAWHTASDDLTRRLLLLQNAAFLPLFHQAMRGRGTVADRAIDQLEPIETGESSGVGEVFDRISSDPLAASRLLLKGLDQGWSAEEVIRSARQLVFLKGNDSHDYKFSSAVLEDFYHVSPQLRNRYLAASVFKLLGSGEKDNPLVDRVRQALQTA